MASTSPYPLLLLRMAVTAAGLLPAVWLWLAWLRGGLSIHPGETLLQVSGTTGLWLLLATIALGPAFRLSHWGGFMAVRRALGLWAWVWLLAHFAFWLLLEQAGDPRWAWEDLSTLAYLQFGAIGLLLLLPLALTSPTAVKRRMPRRAWQWLHRLIYLATAAGLLHVWLQTRADYREALVYIGVFAALLAFRLASAVIDRR